MGIKMNKVKIKEKYEFICVWDKQVLCFVSTNNNTISKLNQLWTRLEHETILYKPADAQLNRLSHSKTL